MIYQKSCGCAWMGNARVSWCGDVWHYPIQMLLPFN